MVTQLHEKLIYFDLVSWDLAIDDAGNPLVIEINLKDQGISSHQVVNGPLFGEFTDQVLEQIYF